MDGDCAYRDKDQDSCTTAVCRYGKCEEKLVKGTADCECHVVDDCRYHVKACSTVTCTAHKCVATVVPAGPAPEQKVGDCMKETCDGKTAMSTRQYDGTDIEDDGNPCTIDACDETWRRTEHKPVANGTACGSGDICFNGKCAGCKPQNPSSCAGEGPGEPANDVGTTAGSYTPGSNVCAFSGANDADWYTFQASDHPWVFNAFHFQFWSNAPLLEACIYVACTNGATPTGCAPMYAGPNGSQGCCWSGPPNTLSPSWDMRCGNTNADSGTAYVRIRAPGVSACVPYLMSGGY